MMKKSQRYKNPQLIGSKNSYILPSGFGWAYGFVLFTLFCGAINYQISLVFLMTFLMAIIGLLSAWQAHANLTGLSITLISIDDCPAGQPACLTLLIQATTSPRFNLMIHIGKNTPYQIEKIDNNELKLTLPLPTTKRGCFALPRIRFSSTYPLGIFTVWSYAYFDTHYYVYPTPVDPGFWPSPQPIATDKKQLLPGHDDLYELKQTDNPWLEPNRIAWKIAAKQQGWYLKTMDSQTGDYWLFHLSDLTSHTMEKKLQYLSYWLQNAETKHILYGLDLANSTVDFGQGNMHLQRCLRQLAVYQS